MEGQEQQQVDIYALVDAYKDLLDTKEELKELTTENNKAIMAARDALAKAMIDAESPRISRAGFVYSLGEKTEYSKRGCNEEEFFDFLRSIGLGDIIKPTVNARTLVTQEDLEDACERCTIFGRVSPEQKKALVIALKAKGHNVAMTGDGVNDIPALKAADCSIAMAGGADAARHAAQLTLLNSDFSVMPEIVLEGRRVINNITRAASLFLTKTLFSFFLSILTLLLPASYPFHPIHLTLISALTVGIPGFFLALEPCRERIRGKFLSTVLLRALPGGIAVTLCAALAMNLTHAGWEPAACSTLATLAAWFVGFLVLLRTCLPLNRNRSVLLCGIAVLFAAILAVAGEHFGLVPLRGTAWLVLAALAVLGSVIVFSTAFVIRRKNLNA